MKLGLSHFVARGKNCRDVKKIPFPFGIILHNLTELTCSEQENLRKSTIPLLLAYFVNPFPNKPCL